MKLFHRLKKQDMAGRAGRVPRHIAIIMDGNGRWAKRRGLPRTAGHSAGAENFRRIAPYCKNIGVKYLTVYAFSTENWKRAEDEVSTIMNLLGKYLLEAIEKMERDGIKLVIFGDITRLPRNLAELVDVTRDINKRVEGFQVNVCINYGGRDEIIKAAERWAREKRPGSTLDEDTFAGYLYSAGVPDPDLVIRPGGEKRISNFLLWQSAYAEYYFTDRLWPDITEKDIDRAIEWFDSRERRFGGI